MSKRKFVIRWVNKAGQPKEEICDTPKERGLFVQYLNRLDGVKQITCKEMRL